MILEKIVEKHVTVQFVKFSTTDSGKNIEIVSKSLEKPLLLLKTAIFTLQIIENKEKQYSFRKQR